MSILQYTLDGQYTIKANTTDFNLSWRKFIVRVANPESYCSYKFNPAGKLALYNHKEKGLIDVSQESWGTLWPVFFETHTYTIVIYFHNLRAGTKPRFIHSNPEVVSLFIDEKIQDTYSYTASINFLNEPGYFEVGFVYEDQEGNQHNEVLGFDVVSPKLDTKNDLNIIIQQIRNEFGDLVFRYLTLTFQQFEYGKDVNNDVIWLSVFKQIIEEYKRAVRFIINAPHNKTYLKEEYRRPDRIKKWNNQLAIQYKNAERQNAEKAMRIYYRVEMAESTNDTTENRFVKYTLERISERLKSLLKKIKSTASKEEIDILDNYDRELESYKLNPLFKTIGRFTGLRQESMVLQQRNGYQQVYRYWLLLQNGLDLLDGETSVGVLPIWKLYELWCFLKIKHLTMEILGIDPTRPDDAKLINESSETVFDPFFGGDMEGTVVYTNRNNGDKVEVGYQYVFGRNVRRRDGVSSSTVTQKPDIVLNITKKDGQVLTYLFDAKYRVKGDEDLSVAEDEPIEDTLNQMHRYRDAIYYGSKAEYNFSKEVIGAYILFPGRVNENDILKSWKSQELDKLPYYLRSIVEVNIGAFPILPNSGSGLILKHHLETILLNKTPLQQIEHSVPQRGLIYMPKNDPWVLVGYCKNDAHLDWIKSKKLYNVRIGMGSGSIRIDESVFSAKYILLHQEGKSICMMKIKESSGPKIVSKKELIALKYPTEKDDDQNYLLYYLESAEDDINTLKWEISKLTDRSGHKQAEPFPIRFSDLMNKAKRKNEGTD